MSEQAIAGKLQQHVVFRSKGPAKIGGRPFLMIISKAKVSYGFFAKKKGCICIDWSDH